MAKPSKFKRIFDYPLTIFPARLAGMSGVTVKEVQEGSGVGGAWDKARKTAYISPHDSAYDRTVRLHESLHALYSPALSPETATLPHQAVEDAIMHLCHARTDGSVRRDEIATALRDLRNVPRMECDAEYSYPRYTAHSPRAADTALLITLRAMAILRSHGDEAWTSSRAALRALRAALDSSALSVARTKAGGESSLPLRCALSAILDGPVRSQDRAAAVTAFRALCATPPDRLSPPPENGGFMVTASGGASGATVQDRIVRATTPAEKGPSKASTLSTGLLSDRMCAAIKRASSRWPNMTIRKLSHVLPRPTHEGSAPKLAMAGLRVRAKKLSVAAVSPVPMRVFERRAHLRGGCVLIDASGSMNFSDEQLRAIIAILPLGTIAYYSGTDDPSQPDGDLVVYADKGMHYDGGDLPFHQGGNSIDLPAIQWLLSQPAPRWYIGDCGFCGAGVAFCHAAREMLENAKTRGMVRHYYDVPSLMASLGIPYAP